MEVRSPRSRDAAFAITTCVVLGAYNNIVGMQRWHRRWYPLANVCATAALLTAAAASGLTAADVGLRRDRLLPGLRTASPLAATAASGLLLTAVLPATRPLAKDERVAALDRRQIAYQVTIRIPFGTVLWEEAAFRGVLQAALRRVAPQPAGIALTSGVFGIWHIRPSIEAIRINRLAGDRRKALIAVTVSVAATTVGGVLLSWLRERSGSLAAPMLLHLTTNCGGALAAWSAAR